MLQIQDGQCGMCAHFGEHDPSGAGRLVQVRVQGKAPEDMIEPCGHPQHEGLNLKVTAISGCTGFEPAKAA